MPNRERWIIAILCTTGWLLGMRWCYLSLLHHMHEVNQSQRLGLSDPAIQSSCLIISFLLWWLLAIIAGVLFVMSLFQNPYDPHDD